MLTDEQKQHYIKTKGINCPFCSSHRVSQGTIQSDGETAWVDVTCENCDKEWQDIYTLSDIKTE